MKQSVRALAALGIAPLLYGCPGPSPKPTPPPPPITDTVNGVTASVAFGAIHFTWDFKITDDGTNGINQFNQVTIVTAVPCSLDQIVDTTTTPSNLPTGAASVKPTSAKWVIDYKNSVAETKPLLTCKDAKNDSPVTLTVNLNANKPAVITLMGPGK